MLRRLTCPFGQLLDLILGLMTLFRPQGLADPMPGTLTQRILAEEGERLRAEHSAPDGLPHWLTLVRLRLHDWIAGPPPERPEDRAIREEGERLRHAFPKIDFDDPTPRRFSRR